jgi:hypothetical protein
MFSISRTDQGGRTMLVRMIGRVVMVSAALLAAAPREADAQPPPSATGGGSGTGFSGMSANPYLNPYLNPFLNPMMTQSAQPMKPTDALLYMYAAQQAGGGIGSGRISGVRPGGARAGQPTATPAYEPDETQRVTDVPGGGAAGFFNRGQAHPQRTGRFYNRPGQYYGNKRR